MCCVCCAVNLFDDQLALHIWLIYIDKVYFAFSKGWVVSLDYGTTAIVALLSGQLQVLVHFEISHLYIEISIFVHPVYIHF